MFWKRANRRSSQASAIASVFGEEHAQAYEAAEKLEATKDIAAIYLSALRLVNQWSAYNSNLAGRIGLEIESLRRLQERDRVDGLTGYIALSSMLDRVDVVIPATPKQLIIDSLIKCNNGQPLWKCNPLQDWIDVTQGSRIDVAPLLFSWEHLCCLYCHTIGALIQSEYSLERNGDSLPILEQRMFKMLYVFNLDAYRRGMVEDLPDEKPDDSKVAYLVGIQIIYERFRSGAAIGILDDLQEAAAGGLMRNYSRAIPKVLRERGMNDSIPDGLLREESSIPTHLQMLTVIDPSIISIKEKAKLLRDGLNHHERLVYLANHDPIVPLCQEG